MRNKCHYAEGIFFGAVIGFILGIFLAPNSGKETREKITKFAKDHDMDIDFPGNTKDKTEQLVSKTMDAIEKGFEKVSRVIDDKKRTQKEAKS